MGIGSQGPLPHRPTEELNSPTADRDRAREDTPRAAPDGRPALAGSSLVREIVPERSERGASYEPRATLGRASVRQASARAALVVRQLMQEGARG